MVGRVIVAGVGPGDPVWLTSRVQALLQEADVLAGFKSAVAVIEPWERGEKVVLDYRNQEAGLATVAARAAEGKLCLVCCYGDPNFSDQEFLSRIRRHWPDLEVVPGISSIQVACAKSGIGMEDSLFISLHRREGYQEAFEELVVAAKEGRRHLIVLPRPWDYMPAGIAQLLLEQGAQPQTKAIVYQRLTLPEEQSHTFSLGELAISEMEFSDLSIMVIFRSLDNAL